MSINEYLKQLVADKLGGDASRFAELWDLEPGFSAKLRSFDEDNTVLHWSPKTFDGWYCIAMPDGFGVYYQERGSKYPPRFFANERDAIEYAVTSSLLPQNQPDKLPAATLTLWQRMTQALSCSR